MCWVGPFEDWASSQREPGEGPGQRATGGGGRERASLLQPSPAGGLRLQRRSSGIRGE
jgi:hypothetical protein